MLVVVCCWLFRICRLFVVVVVHRLLSVFVFFRVLFVVCRLRLVVCEMCLLLVAYCVFVCGCLLLLVLFDASRLVFAVVVFYRCFVFL